MVKFASKKRWADYIILGLFTFLIFCFVFENYIQLPSIVAWLGRWHPLVLHFPIVLLLLLIFLSLTKKKISHILFLIVTISTLITAISGFFLGLESPNKGDLLIKHQWLGISLAIVTTIWYWLHQYKFYNKLVLSGIKIILLFLIGFTGHFGGMITHGENFLAIPTNTENKIPENPIIYRDIVHNILDNNCISCHNPNKKKGGLLMTNFNALLKGGESGKSIIPNNPEQSELIKRLHLPIENEKHMPPEGKTPLTNNEIKILEQWILLGASDTLKLNDLDENTPISISIKKMIRPEASNTWESLPKVTDKTIEALNTDYLTIKRIANGYDALSINCYLPPEYNPKPILDLLPIAKNIIELDLSGLPLERNEFEFLATCENLEHLELDNSTLTDAYFLKLKGLSKIKSLKVYSTKISDKSIDVLNSFENLTHLYIYNTEIDENGLKKLKVEKPSLFINKGISEAIYKSLELENDTISKKLP